MQGKTKGFFEDTGIILVLAAAIYGGYYLFTTFSSDNVKSKISEQSVKQDIIIEDKIKELDNNTTTLVDKEDFLTPNTVIIEKKIEKISSKTVEVKKELESKVIPEIKKEIQKKVIPQVPKTDEVEVKEKKEKNVDLSMLRNFLRNIKFSMASNIVKRDDLNSTVEQELKIRVTVLKDGTYENLVFVDGDKKLFEMNKENLLKVFPVYVDDKIKDDFPRYVRISIK